MSALMLFSLILASDDKYEPLFKKNLSEEVYVDDPIEDWKNDNIYKCPMQYENKTMIILNDSEVVIVEQRAEH